jgi:hypothetical protein
LEDTLTTKGVLKKILSIKMKGKRLKRKTEIKMGTIGY